MRPRGSGGRRWAAVAHVLLTGELLQPIGPGSWEAFRIIHPSLAGPCERYDRFAALWREHGDALLREYVEAHPGGRPFAWWLIDAPREALSHGTVTRAPEPRRQVGGAGRLVSTGVYGAALARAHGVLPVADADSDAPTLIESEAAYLRRHGLLLPGEAALLTPADFAPIEIDSEDRDVAE